MSETRTRTRAIDVTTHEGLITTTRPDYSGGTQEVDMTQVQIPFFGGVEVARVRVQGSITRHLGDTNFVKVDVSVDMPALPSEPEVNRVYDMASTWVADRLEAELTAAMNSRGPEDVHQEIIQPDADAVAEAFRGSGIAPVTS